MGKKTITGIPEEEVMKKAKKHEERISKGFRILMEKWNTPVTVEVDEVPIKVLRPNTQQMLGLMGIIEKASLAPTEGGPEKVKEYVINLKKEVANILPSIIIDPPELRSHDFWESGEYPFDFMLKLISKILQVMNESILSVESFRSD